MTRRNEDVAGLDGIARDLASGAISRRVALRRFGGVALGAMLPGALFAENAFARCPKERRCDGRCCPNHAHCHHGRCKCNRGFTKCNGRCRDLSSDPKHCGACGHACDAGETCHQGVCEPAGCSDGETRSCYTGPAGTAGVGICHGGTQTCEGGVWGPCTGEQTPQAETCGNGLDDDCDGVVDNDCVSCPSGQTNCSGTCVDLKTDANNCGACDHVCSLPNAVNGCHQDLSIDPSGNGVCYVMTCNPGYCYPSGMSAPQNGPGGLGCPYGPIPEGTRCPSEFCTSASTCSGNVDGHACVNDHCGCGSDFDCLAGYHCGAGDLCYANVAS